MSKKIKVCQGIEEESRSRGRKTSMELQENLHHEFPSYERLEESSLSDQIRRETRDRERDQYLQIVARCSRVQDALSYLERLEYGRSSDPQAKDDIHTLKLMMKVLILFVGCISRWQTQHQFLEFRLNPVACVLENVIKECEEFGRDSTHLSTAEDLKPYSTAARFVVSNLVKLRHVKPDIKKLYFVVSRSPKPLAAGEGAEALRFINLVLENTKDVLRCQDDLILLLKEDIEALENKLLVLRNFICFLSEICNWHKCLLDLLTFAEAVAVDAACVLYFVLVDQMMGEDMVQENKIELLHLIERIEPFQPVVKSIYVQALEASRSVIIGHLGSNAHALGFFDALIHDLRELSNKKAKLQAESTDQIDNLLDQLNSIGCYLMDSPLHDFKEGLDNFTTELLDLIIDLGCFIYSNEGSESGEKLNDLRDKIQFVKSASGDLLIPRSWQSNFPTTNELGFIDFIMMNMRERLRFSITSSDPLKCLISTVYEELVALRHDFGEIAELREENEELRALFTNYKDVAYQAEYLVDLYLSQSESPRYRMLGLTDLRESIGKIHKAAKAITRKVTSDNLVHNIAKSPAGVSSEANPSSNDGAMGSNDEVGSKIDKSTDQLVGLDDEKKKIKEQLMWGSKQLSILSIVGMPGIGKTTLANTVYKDPSVTSHFHACAWCSVSQVYESQSLLVEILHQVQRETSQDCKENDKDYDQQLFQSLKGKRYLVVLDDIWDIEAWDDLRPCFPDDKNGSRVIFTTRNCEVAFQAKSVPHALPLLSDEESWKLLQVKVFEEETCPPALLGIGKRIANSCQGLPLAVVLIAGLLKTTKESQDCWESVQKQLRPYVVNYQPGKQLGILELSYIHLPDYLKPCFLYFGAFSEDAEIPARKLVRLWIAEGFVQPPKVNQSSLEYEAENYLNDLIDRSLVMISKRSSTGGVKECRVHDLLHEFCLARAKEERFLLPINRSYALATFRISEMHEQYRLCVRSNTIPSVRMGAFESRVRTLLFGGYTKSYFIPIEFEEMSKQKFLLSGSGRRCHEQLKGIDAIVKFKLLRVLDLWAIVIAYDKDFAIIAHLVHLRYLSISASIRTIPEEIANLKNLQTFILSTATLENVLAQTILSMVSLRHLHIRNDRIALRDLCIRNYRGAFSFQFDSLKCFENFSQLENLTTLSNPALCCDNDIEKIMRKFSNLQKLNCIFLDSWNESKSFNHFPVLDFLNRLKSLKVSFSGKGLYPCNLSFPSSLKKLTLSKSCLPWDEISIFSRLPNLEVLKLLDGAFKGPEWHMKDGEFQELKFLELAFLNITMWNASCDHLPCLEQLVLKRCSFLKEIPSAFGEIPTLRRIQMKQCRLSAVHSVKQIEEEQHEMGNDQFNVFIW